MKQTASILLLALLAFNWVGYRILSGFIEHKSDIALEAQIDQSEFDESTLIELKVPLNAPYLTGNNTEFERFDGELELDGVHYKYVKRKIVNGELVLLCLPNENKNRIQNSRVDFFKLVNDLNHSQDKSKNTNTTVKSFVTEYKSNNNAWEVSALPALTTPYLFMQGKSNISAGYNHLPEQPPKA